MHAWGYLAAQGEERMNLSNVVGRLVAISLVSIPLAALTSYAAAGIAADSVRAVSQASTSLVITIGEHTRVYDMGSSAAGTEPNG